MIKLKSRTLPNLWHPFLLPSAACIKYSDFPQHGILLCGQKNESNNDFAEYKWLKLSYYMKVGALLLLRKY